MYLGDSRSSHGPGYLPLQDHSFKEKGVSLEHRASVIAMRIVDRLDGDGELGQYVEDSDMRGDLVGFMHWPAATRSMGSWSPIYPVAVEEQKDGQRVHPRFLTSGAFASGDSAAAILGPGDTQSIPGVGTVTADAAGQPTGAGGTFQSRIVGVGPSRIKLAESVRNPPPTVIPMQDGRWIGDSRYTRERLSTPLGWPQFPGGYRGICVIGTEESAQFGQFHPTDPRIVAANHAGPHAMGSYLVDLEGAGDPGLSRSSSRRNRLGSNGDDSGKIDLERQAHIQSMMRVLKGPTYPFSPTRSNAAGGAAPAPGETITSPVSDSGPNTIAWNIGKSGLGDTAGGYVIDHETRIKFAPGGGGRRREGPISGTGPDNPFLTGGDMGFGGTSIGSGGALKAGCGGLAPGMLAPGEVRFIPGVGWVRPDFNPGGTQSHIVAGTGAGGMAFTGTGAGGGVLTEQGTPAVARPSSREGAVRAELDIGQRIIAMASTADGGPFDVGSAADPHKLGSDQDGHPINPLHISTDALFRNRSDPREDGTLLFERGGYGAGFDYDNANAVHLFFDHGIGKFRWVSSSPFQITIPPPQEPPPDTPTPGTPGPTTPPDTPRKPPRRPPPKPTTPSDSLVGNAAVISATTPPHWFQHMIATRMELALPSIALRPQMMRDGQFDYRHHRGAPREALLDYDQTTPVVARFEAFGAQGGDAGGPYITGTAGGRWAYGQRPGAGRHPGGTAAGGQVFLPPEVGMEHVDDDFAPVGITPSTAYLMVGPGACFGAGIPELSTGGLATGYSWRESAGGLIFGSHDSAGARTDRVTFSSAGAATFAGNLIAEASFTHTGSTVGLYSTTPAAQPAAITDAVTAHDINATFSDTEVEATLDALGTQLNLALAALRTIGAIAT